MLEEVGFVAVTTKDQHETRVRLSHERLRQAEANRQTMVSVSDQLLSTTGALSLLMTLSKSVSLFEAKKGNIIWLACFNAVGYMQTVIEALSHFFFFAFFVFCLLAGLHPERLQLSFVRVEAHCGLCS